MRQKIVFTQEHDQRIKQLILENKSEQSICDDLFATFNFKVSLSTLKKHINELDIERIDNRKWNGKHRDGYVRDDVSSTDKVPSKYKLKKLDPTFQLPLDDVMRLGLDKSNLPIYFKIIKDKRTGKVEGIECLVTKEDLKWKGGEDCQLYSERWWNIQRMRFDYGEEFHPLLPTQLKGDWKGVVDRWIDQQYPDNMIQNQQEAWVRYVKAVFRHPSRRNRTKVDIHRANKYILEQFNDEQLNELIHQDPETLYKYIPTYLYEKVVMYCLEKLDEKELLPSSSINSVDFIKKALPHLKRAPNLFEVDKLGFSVVKNCLYHHPNDYTKVIRRCFYRASELNLIDPKFEDKLINTVNKLEQKKTKSKKGFELDMLKDGFELQLKKKIEELDKIPIQFRKKYGLE